MQRRTFLKNTSMAAAAVAVTNTSFAFAHKAINPLPEWRGFNLLDFFNPDPAKNQHTTTEEHFKWMRDWGFDFVRIPIAYPYYLDIDRSKNIQPEDVYKTNAAALAEI